MRALALSLVLAGCSAYPQAGEIVRPECMWWGSQATRCRCCRRACERLGAQDAARVDDAGTPDGSARDARWA